MVESTKPQIAIIGAGITGLLLANGFKRVGIDYEIFETEPPNANRAREWSMGVHWSLPLFQEMLGSEKSAGLVAKSTVDCNMDYSTAPGNGALIYDGVSGDVIKDLTVDGTMLRVSRKRLRSHLMEGIDVQFNHTLRSIEAVGEQVELTFAEREESRTFDLVIGCDGVHSTVRTMMYGEAGAAKALDDTIRWRGVICYHDAEMAKFVRSAHPLVSIMIHPQMMLVLAIQDAHDAADSTNWTFLIDFGWPPTDEEPNASDGEEALRRAKEKAQHICEPFRSAIQWITEGTKMQASDLKSWIPLPLEDRFLHDRVVLVGDAAHPMPPYRGQGLNNAVLDAHNLFQTVRWMDTELPSTAEVNDALDAFAREVAERGSSEVKQSVLNGKMLNKYYDFTSSPYAQKGLSKS